MSSKTLQLTDELYQYYQNHTLRDNDVLKDLRQTTAKLPGAIMQISPEQGQFMAFLIKAIKAKKILEIGTFTGYSALVMAQALPADGHLITCDIDKNNTDLAKTFWQKAQVLDKITLKLGPALQTLESLLKTDAESFDFVFIDADKNNYPVYYEASLKLIKQGGIIALDNVLWSGEVANPNNQDAQTQTLRKLNDLILQDARVEMCMIPMSDGISLVQKR